ncbi:MAG: hypothetical protein U5R30_16130 [Deltaproteobacteria bacterium]|nr:hypothetical protein [Deltaproteobacteria bacterium]
MKKAEKGVFEIASAVPELDGSHKYIPEDPSYRRPIPLYRAADCRKRPAFIYRFDASANRCRSLSAPEL